MSRSLQGRMVRVLAGWIVLAWTLSVAAMFLFSDRALVDADFQKHSLKAISLAALAIALAGMLMGWSLARALRPLAALEQATRDRSRFDLTPLPTASLPSELLPLVDSFNDLLRQLDLSMQAERQFIGDAAHELRTPLSALQAQLEVAMRAQSAEERALALRKLLAGVQRSSRLSEQLLDMARLEAGDRASTRDWHALDRIVGHVASEFEMSAGRQGRTIELDVEPCRIHCDVDEIGILVRNLLDNALRYTFEGGRVRISCGQRSGQSFLEIADDGPGVPAELHGAMFERFRRLPGSSLVRGSGIGLSLVARIARMHRAQIQTGAGFGAPGLSVRLLFPLSLSAAA